MLYNSISICSVNLNVLPDFAYCQHLSLNLDQPWRKSNYCALCSPFKDPGSLSALNFFRDPDVIF